MPGYEPDRLASVMSVRDIFNQEPRDENWAPAVETWLTSGQRDDMRALIGKDFGLRNECRTTICRLSWDVPEGSSIQDFIAIKNTFSSLVSVLYQGVMTEPSSKPEIYIIYAGGISNIPMGEPEALFAELRKRRAGKLNNIKRGMLRRAGGTALTLMPSMPEMAARVR
jgi:hypothetical protein